MKNQDVYDRKVWKVFGKVGDIAALNIVYLICCIPIFTIGAAKAALYGVTKKMAKQEEGYLIPMFFAQFKENFKAATAMWLMYIAVVAVSVFDIYISGGIASDMPRIFIRTLMSITILVVSMMLIYALALQTTFENTIGNTIKNALIMTIRHLPFSLVMMLLNLSPFLFVVFLTGYIAFEAPLLMFLWFSGVAYINSFLLNRIFAKYM